VSAVKRASGRGKDSLRRGMINRDAPTRPGAVLDPCQIVRYRPETPAQIHYRTRIPMDLLCEKLVLWFEKGIISAGEITCSGWRLPVFFRQAFK
jgi:hypothetical protein